MQAIHYLAPAFANAPRLSPSQVAAKLRAGWRWHRLQPSFGACAGTAQYSRALVSPAGEIAIVSDRAGGMAELDTLPTLAVSYRLIELAVPFADKDAAKRLGAVWVGHRKTWACAPTARATFAAWLTDREFDLLDG